MPINFAVDNSGQPAQPVGADGGTAYRRPNDTQFQNCGVPGWQSAAERVYLSARIFGQKRKRIDNGMFYL